MAAKRKCLRTDDAFRLAVANSLSVAQVLGRIGLVPAGANYKTVHGRIAKLGLDTSHFTGAGSNVEPPYQRIGKHRPPETLLVENSAYNFTQA